MTSEVAQLLGPDQALPKLPPLDSKTHSQHYRFNDVASNHSSSIAQTALSTEGMLGSPHCQRASSSVPPRAALACAAPSLQPSKAPALNKLTVGKSNQLRVD